MNVSSRPLTGNAVLVEIEGEANSATASRINAAFLELIGKGGHNLVVNLDKVTAVDASGLSVLIGAVKKLREGNGDMKIVCSDAKIKEAFQCTGLTKLFQIFESNKEVGENLTDANFPCLNCPLFVGISNCPTVKSFAYAASPCKPGAHLQWLTRSFKKILESGKPENPRSRLAQKESSVM